MPTDAAHPPSPTNAVPPAAMGGRGFTVRALGEIAIRCKDIAAMRAFYETSIGLPLLAVRPSGIVFLRISEGHAGHTCVLALFPDDDARTDNGNGAKGEGGNLHHLALTIDYCEQAAAMRHFDCHAIAHRVEEFPWIGWRGLFVTDPEGNTVELVAADPNGPRP
ncbi:MAG: VOC family protein [Pseudomonadota bacterium]